MSVDVQFREVIIKILAEGTYLTTRNSDVLRSRNQMITFDKTPLISMRRTAWKNALREFEWFLSGSNNINDLHPKVRHWWAPWANDAGFIHNNYSKQFRTFEGSGHIGGSKYHHSVDQVKYLMDTITNDPFSRRAVITTWHTHDMISPVTPITNCHGTAIQLFVEDDGSLHLTMYQRSGDMILGVPHNFIQYWAFLMYLARQCGKTVGTLTWIGGDCHIYKDHIDMARKMIKLDMKQIDDISLVYQPTSTEFKADDFSLDSEYKPLIKENLVMTV